MFRVTVSSKGEDLFEFSKKMTKHFHFEMQNQLNLLGEETHKFMQDEIRNNTGKRAGGTGSLIKNIQYEFEQGENYGFWIGDIDFLNENSKQWFWLNYGYAETTGRRVPPANRGYFTSGSGMSGDASRPSGDSNSQQWIHTGDRHNYLLIPQKPLEPINYIENSISFLLAKLDLLLAADPSTFRE